MPEDVLQHDDRVVDQHPHTQRQAAQAHDVEADAEGEQQTKGQNHADGDRERDRDGVAGVVQKEEEHQKGERSSQRQRLHDVRDGVADEAGLRIRDAQRHRRVLVAELGQHLIHTFRHLNGVRARLLIYKEAYRLLAVVAGDRLPVGETVLDRRHIPQEDHRASPAATHHRLADLR